MNEVVWIRNNNNNENGLKFNKICRIEKHGKHDFCQHFAGTEKFGIEMMEKCLLRHWIAFGFLFCLLSLFVSVTFEIRQ